MNDKDQKDVYERLKNSGYNLAQTLYKTENSRISNLQDLIKKYTGRMFNYIHNNRSIEFILYLEKICASICIQPKKDLLELLRAAENNTVFKRYALAFMMGFMAERKNDMDDKGEKL